jgi:hypothetical protein
MTDSSERLDSSTAGFLSMIGIQEKTGRHRGAAILGIINEQYI